MLPFPHSSFTSDWGWSEQPGSLISLPSLIWKKGKTFFWNEWGMWRPCTTDTVSRYRADPEVKIPDFTYRPALEPHFLAYFKKAISYKDIFNINHSFIYMKSAVLKVLCISLCISPILIDTDILSARMFLLEFSIVIQIKTNYKWGNCTRNRRFVLLRISSPLAALDDCLNKPSCHTPTWL